jgi:AcrR family transcriptional regulator
MLRKQNVTDRPGNELEQPAALGQRERNKRDKLQRIKNAARELFVTRGYDDTTTREIALRAGVGMGTVFTYADNKRDLLFLIANEDLEQITQKSESEISSDSSLMTNLMVVFGNHYRYFMQQPELSRLMLREMLFYDSGQQSNRFKTTREKVISLVCRSVSFAKENKSLAKSCDEQLAGWVLFCIYQVELRNWLATDVLDLDAALARLRRALQVCLVGLAVTESALQVSKRQRHRQK